MLEREITVMIFKAEMPLNNFILDEFIAAEAHHTYKKYKVPKRLCRSTVSSM